MRASRRRFHSTIGRRHFQRPRASDFVRPAQTPSPIRRQERLSAFRDETGTQRFTFPTSEHGIRFFGGLKEQRTSTRTSSLAIRRIRFGKPQSHWLHDWTRWFVATTERVTIYRLVRGLIPNHAAPRTAAGRPRGCAVY